MYCYVPGCHLRAPGWSRYCSTHKSRNRRHGHPCQQGVTKADLRPYLEIIDGYRERNPENPTWTALQEQWDVLASASRALVTGFHAGRAVQRHQRQAAEEILNLDANGKAAAAIDTSAALILMRYRTPSRFRSDNSVYFQVSRRVRSLTDTHVGTWWDNSVQRVKRVYRDVPPRTARALGQALVQQFGELGFWLHGKEQERNRRERERVDALHRALGNLE